MVESCVRAQSCWGRGEDGGPGWDGRGRGTAKSWKGNTVPHPACFHSCLALSVWMCSKWLLESVLWGPLTQPAAPLPVTRLGLWAAVLRGPGLHAECHLSAHHTARTQGPCAKEPRAACRVQAMGPAHQWGAPPLAPSCPAFQTPSGLVHL